MKVVRGKLVSKAFQSVRTHRVVRSNSVAYKQKSLKALKKKTYMNVRDVLFDLGIQQYSHFFTDKGITNIVDLCAQDEEKLKTLLLPVKIRKIVLLFIKFYLK